LKEALAVEEAGAFSIVLEGIPTELAQVITAKLTIPTIGIGAGPHCDGQIQVFHDLLGLSHFIPRHAKPLARLGDTVTNVVKQYRDEVSEGCYLEKKNTTSLKSDVLEKMSGSQK